MDIFLTRTPFGLQAFMDNDADLIKATITKPRNILFHRKFWALMNLVFENQDKYAVIDDLLVEVKLKAGHYVEHITTKGKIVYVPKSISFSEMDEYAFSNFYTNVLNILGKLINVDSEKLREQVEGFYTS